MLLETGSIDSHLYEAVSRRACLEDAPEKMRLRAAFKISSKDSCGKST